MSDMMILPPLEYFRSFVVFVDSDNIIKAASRLRISQPLLSKQLKALEEELGVVLFEFRGRKKVLTRSGEDIYRLAKSQLQALEADLHQTLLKTSRRKHLRLGGRREILENFVGKVQYEGSLSYVSMDSLTVEKGLKDRTLDLGISQKEILSDNLIRKKMRSDEFVFVWNKSLKIEEDLKKLAEFRCYDYAESSILAQVSEIYEIPQIFEKTTFSDWKVLAQAISLEKAWGVLPISFATLHSSVEYRKISYDLKQKVQFYIYYQKEFAKLPWLSNVVNQLTR
jgi:DNA-binding transcriptional LysR family regulator